MKRIQLILAAALLISLILSGCGSDERLAGTDVSTMLLDGKQITVLNVSDFDTAVYEEAGLKKMISEETKAYNEAAGGKRVIFKKLEVKDGKAYLTMVYETAEDYAAFNNVTFANGPLSDTDLPDETRILSTDGKLLTTVGALKEDAENEWMLLVLEEPMRVYTGGTVCYIAGEAAAEDAYVSVGDGLDPDEFLPEPCYVVYK